MIAERLSIGFGVLFGFGLGVGTTAAFFVLFC
jgi:hypothetical protein